MCVVFFVCAVRGNGIELFVVFCVFRYLFLCWLVGRLLFRAWGSADWCFVLRYS